MLEFSCVSSGFCEDGNTISILIAIDELDGLIESVDSADNHHGCKKLIVVTSHSWFGMVNDSWTNPVTVWKAVNISASSIKDDLCTLSLGFRDLIAKSVQSLFGVERSDVSIIISTTNRESLGLL